MNNFFKKSLLTVMFAAVAVIGYSAQAYGQAPIVSPARGALTLASGASFKITIDHAAISDVARLEVDHSLESTFPEFHLAADSTPYESSADESAFTAAGVAITYSGTVWTIDFGPTLTEAFVQNGGITFYLALKDGSNAYLWGDGADDVISTTPDNTFAYTLTRAPEPQQPSTGGSRVVGSSGSSLTTATVPSPSESEEKTSTSTETPIEKENELSKLSTVQAVQAFLNEKGFGPLAVDGIAGALTQAAIARYEATLSVSTPSSSAKVTVETADVLRAGSRGEGVQQLQQVLNEKGFGPLAVDGMFGQGTQSAVVKFQTANLLVADGIVGPKTLAALNK